MSCFLKIKEVAHMFFSTSFKSILILTKNGLGYILGDFFKNPSGRPALKTGYDFILSAEF
jgi:hypothetical protein